MSDDLMKRLQSLHKQATVDRSHFYVGSCAEDAMHRIEELEVESKTLRSMVADVIHDTGDDPEIMAASRAEWAARTFAAKAELEQAWAENEKYYDAWLDAQAEIVELEAKLKAKEKLVLALAGDKIDLVSELAGVKGKLMKAREEGFWAGRSCGGAKKEIDSALAELKGQDNE